jgi:GT2 family glycosyltransferase
MERRGNFLSPVSGSGSRFVGSQPLVSAIVLNYNGERSIAECLRSIREQTYPRIEIIVVDNASGDRSPEIVERGFPSATLVRNKRNLGFAEGNNVGIRASKGELVVLVNNDLVLERDAIEKMVAQMLPSTGILGGAIYNYYGAREVWAFGAYFEPVSGMHWQAFQGAPGGEILPARLAVDYVPGALLMMRRSVLEKAGLLGSYFFLYGDDIDLACKVRRLGYSIEVTSSAKCFHMISQSVRAEEKKGGKNGELRGFYMMNKNMFYFYFSQLPLAMALSSTFSQLSFLLFEILLFRRRRAYAAVKIRALGRALADLAVSGGSEKRKVREMGKLPIAPSIRKLLRTAKMRGSSRVYYW